MVDKMLCACRHVLQKRLMQREGCGTVQGAHRSNTWPMAANCANTCIILHRQVTITCDGHHQSSHHHQTHTRPVTRGDPDP